MINLPSAQKNPEYGVQPSYKMQLIILRNKIKTQSLQKPSTANFVFRAINLKTAASNITRLIESS